MGREQRQKEPCPDCGKKILRNLKTGHLPHHKRRESKTYCNPNWAPRPKGRRFCPVSNCHSHNLRPATELKLTNGGISQWRECLDCGSHHISYVRNGWDAIKAAKRVAQAMANSGATGTQINDRMTLMLGIPVSIVTSNSWFNRTEAQSRLRDPLTDKLNAIHRRISSKRVPGVDTYPDLDGLEKEIEKMLAGIDADLEAIEKRKERREGRT